MPPGPDDDLLPVVAHQLLNSLTVIGGYATTLRMAGADQGELVTQCAAVIERQTASMEALIRRASDARHMELGTLELQTEPVDVAALTQELCSEHERVELEATAAAVALADRARLRGVLTNLITNAVKFGPPDGTVRVAVSAGEGVVSVRVSDDGAGIDEPDRERIFEKFTRLRPRVPGSGLGLYTGRGIARAQHGDLRVVPDAAGTCFELLLPAG